MVGKTSVKEIVDQLVELSSTARKRARIADLHERLNRLMKLREEVGDDKLILKEVDDAINTVRKELEELYASLYAGM